MLMMTISVLVKELLTVHFPIRIGLVMRDGHRTVAHASSK